MRYFLAVADDLNFSRAAERLGIAQPPLSRQIHALETNLGVRLFARGKRRVEMTDAGRAYQEEARVVVERVEHATEVARRAGRGEVGRLAVGFGPIAEMGLVPRLVPTFAQSHPGVRLELHSLRAGDHLTALRNGSVHATLLILPVASYPDVTIERLQTQPLVVAVARNSKLARRRTLTLASLAHEPLVMFPRPLAPGLHDAVVSSFHDAGIPIRMRHEAAHPHLAFALISAGIGVTLLPLDSESFCHDGIVYRPLEQGPTIDVGMMYRQEHPSELLRGFLTFARQLAKRAKRRGGREALLN